MNAVLTKDAASDIGIDVECPICAKHQDPATGNPRYNSKALAAVAEAEAMFSAPSSSHQVI